MNDLQIFLTLVAILIMFAWIVYLLVSLWEYDPSKHSHKFDSEVFARKS